VCAFDFTFILLLEERHGSHHTKGIGILSDRRDPEDDAMDTRVLLAGATGVIGKRLVPLLLQGGSVVFGTTRSAARAAELRRGGIEPVVVDVFDAPRLTRAVLEVAPAVVIHQLTDLALIHDPNRLPEALTRNARLRAEGTQNLVGAAVAAGVRRLIAQSIAWVYAPGPEPHTEEDPLNLDATGTAAITVGGVMALEHTVLTAPRLEGIVLRYGWLYGPGTGREVAAGSPALHVDAAALAAWLAMARGAPGVFNIAEPSPLVLVQKAQRELGWDPGFRLPDGAASGGGDELCRWIEWVVSAGVTPLSEAPYRYTGLMSVFL
jgi:nucleoside-diphosphate-sugar epimerase